MARLKILSEDDFNKLYQIPRLAGDEEREVIFGLDETDKKYLATFDDISMKINYILQAGYFRIMQYFFQFTFQGVRADVWHIIHTYFPDAKFPKKQISLRKHYANRDAILKKYEMRMYSDAFTDKLHRLAKGLAKLHTVPKYIFDSLLDFIHVERAIRPN